LVTLAAIIWAFYNGAYIIVPTFGPPLLSSKGMVFAEAAVLVSFTNWLIIGSVPFGGWMAQKFRRPNTFMVLGFILFGSAMLLLPFGSAIPLIILIGIFGGIPAGSIMAIEYWPGFDGYLQPVSRRGASASGCLEEWILACPKF
jgi:hypothetical protein